MHTDSILTPNDSKRIFFDEKELNSSQDLNIQEIPVFLTKGLSNPPATNISRQGDSSIRLEIESKNQLPDNPRLTLRSNSPPKEYTRPQILPLILSSDEFYTGWTRDSPIPGVPTPLLPPLSGEPSPQTTESTQTGSSGTNYFASIHPHFKMRNSTQTSESSLSHPTPGLSPMVYTPRRRITFEPLVAPSIIFQVPRPSYIEALNFRDSEKFTASTDTLKPHLNASDLSDQEVGFADTEADPQVAASTVNRLGHLKFNRTSSSGKVGPRADGVDLMPLHPVGISLPRDEERHEQVSSPASVEELEQHFFTRWKPRYHTKSEASGDFDTFDMYDKKEDHARVSAEDAFSRLDPEMQESIRKLIRRRKRHQHRERVAVVVRDWMDLNQIMKAGKEEDGEQVPTGFVRWSIVNVNGSGSGSAASSYAVGAGVEEHTAGKRTEDGQRKRNSSSFTRLSRLVATIKRGPSSART